MKVKESDGRGPALHDTNKPVTMCSKIPFRGPLWTSLSEIGAVNSMIVCTSLVEIIRKAAVITCAQLERGGARHQASLSIASNAASPTMDECSNGSTYFT